MPKYRYESYNPHSSKFKRNRIITLIKIVVGWHAIGYTFIKFCEREQRRKDPEYDKKSPTDKYLHMLNYKDGIDKVKIQFSKEGVNVTHEPKDGTPVDQSTRSTEMSECKKSTLETFPAWIFTSEGKTKGMLSVIDGHDISICTTEWINKIQLLQGRQIMLEG